MREMLGKLMVVVLLALFGGSATADPSESWVSDLEKAKWIGLTQDDRPKEWAYRDLFFSKPPHDIASWVPTEEDLRPTPRAGFVSPLLRKAFQVGKPVESAEVAVSGLGLYELWFNGEKVGDHVLSPAQTTYDKRVFYNVYDVTEQLRSGDNAIGIMLGNGFYGQNIAFRRSPHFGAPRAIAVLRIRYRDGSALRVVSDESWRSSSGPILFDNVYFGETYDARRLPADWSAAGFNDAEWVDAELMEAPGGRLERQRMEPMRKVRKVDPLVVLPADDGWIVDMGENMTGWLRISVEEDAGTAVRMRFAEHLMPDRRSVDTASTGTYATGVEQIDIYLCRGGGVETWEPRFTYHGFRYVQITGLSRKPALEDLTGWFVRTDVARIGTFESSDPMINTFYEVSMRTIEGNLQGLLSDCPHRERCAWMGDMHAVGQAASYNYDLRQFWSKTMRDIRTMLGKGKGSPERGLPKDHRAPCNIAVGKRNCGQARPDWGAATVLVPWFAYLHYGDLGLVEEAWPMMEGWMAYLAEFAEKDGIVKDGFGDWCPPGTNANKNTPSALTSTALYYRSLKVMIHFALLLDKPDSADLYANRADIVKKAFNERFYTTTEIAGKPVATYGTQTGSAVALHAGLVPAGDEQRVADGLAVLIMEKEGGHYTTGILGHRPLYTMLNDYGHGEVTRHLWKITDWPSLGFMTEVHDLTTWPEAPYNWDKTRRYRLESFNHPMHAGFAATFHESIGGIRPDPNQPGYKHIILKPCFLPDLEWAKTSLRSPRGPISSDWKREGNSVVWEVLVPDESTATLHFPDGRKPEKVQAGNHRFEIELQQEVAPE